MRIHAETPGCLERAAKEIDQEKGRFIAMGRCLFTGADSPYRGRLGSNLNIQSFGYVLRLLPHTRSMFTVRNSTGSGADRFSCRSAFRGDRRSKPERKEENNARTQAAEAGDCAYARFPSLFPLPCLGVLINVGVRRKEAAPRMEPPAEACRGSASCVPPRNLG